MNPPDQAVSISFQWKSLALQSFTWLALTWLLWVILALLMGFIIVKGTAFGRRWWLFNHKVITPTWIFRCLSLLLLLLIQVRIVVLFTYAQSNLLTSLQQHNSHNFWFSIACSMGLVAGATLIGLVEFYAKEMFNLYWFKQLSLHLLQHWIDKDGFYAAKFLPISTDNPDQRIEADTRNFSSTTIQLGMRCVFALTSVEEAVRIIWHNSGTLTIGAIHIPKALLSITIVYTIIMTIIAFYLAKPLARLDFKQQKLDANYRFRLTTIRLNSTPIAVGGGKNTVSQDAHTNLGDVIKNATIIVYAKVVLNTFNSFVEQVAQFMGFIVQAPLFFGGTITLGELTQSNAMVASLSGNLAFIQNSLDVWNEYTATCQRLAGLHSACVASSEINFPQPAIGHTLCCRNVSITSPTQVPLIREANFTLTPGDSLLIEGPSGIGKSTLLGALEGLWPYVTGEITTAQNRLYITQHMYFNSSILRECLSYPAGEFCDEDMIQALDLVGFPAKDLNAAYNWFDDFSTGQLQRIAFARILLHKPELIFLDEATSALDTPSENELYNLLRENLPQSITVSIGHRENLRNLHNQLLSIAPDGTWTLQASAVKD